MICLPKKETVDLALDNSKGLPPWRPITIQCALASRLQLVIKRAIASSYFYLRPGAFNLVGFAYGKVDGVATRGGKLKVKLVPSGRWVEEQMETTELTHDELKPRAVTEEEALDGVGTFVGSAICTSRVRPGGARLWDYGLVVGYKWWSSERQGWLDVNFGGTADSIQYSPESTQDVAVEIYALQPCGRRSTNLVMAVEAKQKHSTVYNRFNGINQTAVRDSKVLLAEVGGEEIGESKTVPLLDIASFNVSEMPVRHILDYVFYKEGNRTHPTGVRFGETIFDTGADARENDQPDIAREAEVMLSDGLSDSEDDDDVSPGATRSARPSRQPPTKRRRTTDTGFAAETRGATNLAGTSRLEHDVEHLISLREHHIYWRKFGFFPHPAVLRALFGWDFGTRGLSILHFSRVTEQEKRARVRGNDMSNFSRKNALPTSPAPADFSVLSGAVEVLCAVTQQLYKPVVHDTLVAASRFLSELRVSELPTSPEALTELAAWVDDRLELFRLLISEENWLELGQIKDQFCASHESFVRVNQVILRQDVIAATKAANATSNRNNRQNRGDRHSESDKRVFIPKEIRQALPKQGNKEPCLRFLSAQ
ncbi:hypothetical protein PHMEG_00018909, partial [Phytophthora megakarya]